MESLTFQNERSTDADSHSWMIGHLPFAYTFRSSIISDENLQNLITKELPLILDSVMSNIRYDKKVIVGNQFKYIKKLGDKDRVIIDYIIREYQSAPLKQYIEVYLTANTSEERDRIRDAYKDFIQDEILKKLKIAYSTQNKKTVSSIKEVSPNTDIARNIATFKGDLPKVRGLDIGQGRKRKTRKHRSRKVKKTRKH